MNSFVALSLENVYRTSTHRIGRDFHARLLGSSTRYRRAAGYFSSGVFSVAPEAHLDYFARGGRIDLVCSECFSRLDAQALASAVYERPRVRGRFRLESIVPGDIGSRISWQEFFAWLVASDYLDVRIARLTIRRDTSLYHEKIGLFYDSDDNVVAFSGSANETEPGYVSNFERVDVFASFGDDAERRRARGIEAHFHELWTNRAAGLEVTPLHIALRRGHLREHDVPETHKVIGPTHSAAFLPETLLPRPGLKLFRHQEQAIASWAQGGGRGILEMATGSGKTITALSLASRLYDRLGAGFSILIVAPLIHLVDQWIDVARDFGLNPIRCAEGTAQWFQDLSVGIQSLNASRRPVLSVVTTAATMTAEAFQQLIGSIRKPLLLIADEAHSYGAPTTFLALPKGNIYRVGLSATPVRWMDEAGTQRLRSYFGPVVFRYTLADALRDEVLTPYRYYPELLRFTDDEMDEYLQLTRQLVRYLGEDENGPMNDVAKRLLIRRARLVASAKDKLPRLRQLMAPRTKDTHILVYCGDGTLDEADGEETIRQVDAATRLIGTELNMVCASYTAETPPTKRRELLEAFTSGDLQVLVAIRCLDEGVDIPATRTAYILASSTNPRQFVQRRGRVLRRAPGKVRSDIYDFFVVPSPADFPRDSAEYKLARGLLRTQLARSQEFCDLAENGPSARQRLLDLRNHFDLLTEG